VKTLNKDERLLLYSSCKKNKVSFEMAEKMLETAKLNDYENKTAAVRKKELMDLVEFFLKTSKGE